jgi:superfamily II DNA or RNA helicase
MLQKRKYQSDIINQIKNAIKSGSKSILLVAPTGSGKTKMVSCALKESGVSVLALAHTREICEQIRKEFSRTGPNISVVSGIRSGNVPSFVSSKDIDAIFIDEAHHCPAKSYKRIIDAKGDKILIGATATPYRADSASLSRIFQTIISAPNEKELTSMGYLAKVEYVSSNDVDYQGIKLNKRKEFDEKEALKKVRISVQAGDLINAWKKYAKGRNAIIYTINIEHAEQVEKELIMSGVSCGLVTGRLGKKKRDEIIDGFSRGNIRALINCQVLTEGTDVPNVGAIIMLRPTMSRSLYKQMIGRGMRPDKDCVVIDHVGNYLRHGRVFDENPLSVMKNSRLEHAQGDTVTSMDISENYVKMGLHIEKVDSSLSRIWTPSIFGGAQ